MKLTTYEYGTPRKRGEGLRIGATRRPPRGIPKEDWVREGYFDHWLRILAPSESLLSWLHGGEVTDARWNTFVRRYEGELARSKEATQVIELLATIAKNTPLSIGCYCEDEAYCHRLTLAKVIRAADGKATSSAGRNG